MDQKIKAHFKKVDLVLFNILELIELQPYVVKKPADFFAQLCDSIVSQQLSGKAADTIFNRFKALFPKGQITPQQTLKIKEQKLRSVGLSRAKATYIKDLAQKVVNKQLVLADLPNLSDEEIINELIKVKGIGRWTAEMFLMFTLGREDIFSTGDLGLVNAIKKLYKVSDKPTQLELIEISLKWSPYRSTASRILWKSLDLK